MGASDTPIMGVSDASVTPRIIFWQFGAKT